MIIKQVVTGLLEVFCYILGCEETREAVIIDPGGDEEQLLDLVNGMNLTVKYIINTHNHPDHVCGNARIKQATGAQVVMHEDDHKFFNKTEPSAWSGQFGFPRPPPPDRLVRDNDIIHFGRHELTVIHTPGHSPGSICLLGEGNLFTGDSLFVGAAGRVDIPGGDFNTQMNSLAEKIVPLPEETIVWPGHDYGDTPTSSIGREKRENPYLGGEW